MIQRRPGVQEDRQHQKRREQSVPKTRKVLKEVLRIRRVAAEHRLEIRLLEKSQSADSHADQQQIQDEMNRFREEVQEGIAGVGGSGFLRGETKDQANDEKDGDQSADIRVGLKHERLLRVVRRDARYENFPCAKHQRDQKKDQSVQRNVDGVVTGRGHFH